MSKNQLETYQAEIQKAFLVKEGMLNVLCAGSTAYRSKMFEQAKYITSNKLNIENKKEKS